MIEVHESRRMLVWSINKTTNIRKSKNGFRKGYPPTCYSPHPKRYLHKKKPWLAARRGGEAVTAVQSQRVAGTSPLQVSVVTNNNEYT